MPSLDEYIDGFTRRINQAGFTIAEARAIAHGRQLLVVSGSESVPVNIYSGKKGISVVVGGSAASSLKQSIEAMLGRGVAPSVQQAAPESSASELPPGFENVANFDYCWSGTDESGKGDFFGPLVVAAVRVDRASAQALTAIGIKDSKALTDVKAKSLASRIREICPGSFVELEITPSRYNTLYQQLRSEGKNLNHLLAWAHARALEDLLQKAPCQFAIADKFADEKFILSRLMAKGRQITLVQTPKAERNIAVAAASVLARDRFLARMEELSVRFGLTFPKGASQQVVEAGKAFVQKNGRAGLAEVAKMHFKTMEQL